MTQQSFRHHYIPIFYLQAWTDPGGVLCEFSRPRDRVLPKRVAPKGTGFERHLYTVPGLPKERQSVLEDEFFRDTDTIASEALCFMIKTGGHDMSDRLRNGWSRFLNSLGQRHPEKVAQLKQMSVEHLEVLLERIRVGAGSGEIPPLPEGVTFEQFAVHMRQDVRDKRWADLLQSVIDSSIVGLFISNMRWSLVTLKIPGRELLTSDRPIIMTNGIDHLEGHIVLPISPTQLFVAVNTIKMEDQLRTRDPRELMSRINDRVTSQAQKFVYSTDERQLRFVENRLGRSREL